MTGAGWQSLGLSFDIFGVILLAIGALDRKGPIWDDLEKKSLKTKWILRWAWIGVALAIIGFMCQIKGLLFI